MANTNPSDCDCVILCGGLGKRLKPVVDDVPKVMAKIDGRPFLDYVIEYLKEQSILRIILATGYKADVVEKHYQKHNFGLAIECSRESEPLGTGGAVKLVHDSIVSDQFFVLNGDSFLPADLQSILDFHYDKRSQASIVVSKVGDGQDFGSLKLDGDDKIISFQEKIDDASTDLVNAGVYCFNKDIFSRMPEQSKFSLEKDFFPKLAGSQMFGYTIDEEFVDIGTPERYKLAQIKMKKG